MFEFRAKFIRTVILEPGDEGFTLTSQNILNRILIFFLQNSHYADINAEFKK